MNDPTWSKQAAQAPSPGPGSGPSPGPGLVAEGLQLDLQGKPLFKPLTFRIEAGQVLTLMGPSGCGKSSIVHALCGTLDPVFGLTGKISLDGRDLRPIAAEKRGIGVLFQDDALFPHLNVWQNVAFALPAGHRGLKSRKARALEALEGAGLAAQAEQDPYSLSGGQRSRVALLRTLLSGPRALLLDEPFSKLDANLRDQVRQLVFTQAAEVRLPVLLVTHDQADATAAGGPVLSL